MGWHFQNEICNRKANGFRREFDVRVHHTFFSTVVLQDEVRRWLDAEWIPRSIHATIGSCAGRTLLRERSSGVSDVSSLLFTIAEDLQKEVRASLFGWWMRL